MDEAVFKATQTRSRIIGGIPRTRWRTGRGRSHPTRSTLNALVALVAAAAAVVAACASPPTPSATQPAKTVRFAIEVGRAPDRMLEFFGSEVHARLSGAGWTSEWVVPDGNSSTDVPSGAVMLEMWTVVHGDTLTCAIDPATARESCFQPIIGTGQTCSLAMDLAPDARVSIRFRLLPQERCELTGDAPS